MSLQLFDPSLDGVTRQTSSLRHRRDASPANGFGLGSSPAPSDSLIHQRSERFIFGADFENGLWAYHKSDYKGNSEFAQFIVRRLLNVLLPQSEAELEAFIGQPLPQTEAEVEAFIDHWRDLINKARTEQGKIKRSELLCSFCDRKQSEVGKLMAAPQTYICDYCISEIAESMKMIR